MEFLFGYFILETRSLFLDKTIQTGEYLAQSYVDKIDTRMEEYTFSVELAGQFLGELYQDGATDEALQQWLKSYNDKVDAKFGDNILDYYTVVDGSLIGANPWEGDGDYDYQSKSWYYEAVAQPGQVVFSGLYTDVITGRNVFTISMASAAGSGNVIALDVYLTSENWMGFSDLPDGYGLYVFDAQTSPAYTLGQSYLTEFPAEAYTALQCDDDNHTIHYEKAAGANYNLYLCGLDNGWSAIVAIPSENLVSDEHMFLMNMGLWLNILNVAIVIVFLIKNELGKRKHSLDTLTGLLNKSYFMKCVRFKLKRGSGVLLMIDLDNFKRLNDNYGHDSGDAVLKQVAALLDGCFRKTDYIGRFGGDEFIVYLDTALPDAVLMQKTAVLIQQVSVLGERYPRSGLSVSIGGCRCRKGDKYSVVFKGADEALYAVKQQGKSGFAMHDHT